MDFEWDEAKRQANIEKHGIDFVRAREIFDGRPVVSYRSSYAEEERWLTIGIIDGRFFTVVWTRRGETVRLVSARRSRDGEERAYRAIHEARTR
jgi:uncharacterized protein